MIIIFQYVFLKIFYFFYLILFIVGSYDDAAAHGTIQISMCENRRCINLQCLHIFLSVSIDKITSFICCICSNKNWKTFLVEI